MKKFILSFLMILSIFMFFGCLSVEKPEEEETPIVKSELSIQELILAGRSDEARSLFQSKTNINGTDEYGNTALHSAAAVDDYDLINFLIYMGADTEIKNMNGDTPLHIAIKNNALKSTEILAALDGNIFAKDGSGASALELGVKKGKNFYDALITQKTGDLIDGQGQTIVHYFAKWKNNKPEIYLGMGESSSPVTALDEFYEWAKALIDDKFICVVSTDIKKM